ncbi:hypothetical protein [Clavibacter zhangzhiyongii]|uniref:hypothetical protein n=1 Tax=Clavibacter zhangzhiyongii TaxID=2768071 RepID=UPI0039DF3DCA
MTTLVMLAIDRGAGSASFVASTPSKPTAPTAETPSPGQVSGVTTLTTGGGASTWATAAGGSAVRVTGT